MKNCNYTRGFGRSFIVLLLVLTCVTIPVVRPLHAAVSSTAGDSQRLAARCDAIKSSSNASAVQFKSLPLRFELNAGQTDPQVRFIACSQSGDMFLTAREMVLRVREASFGTADKPGTSNQAEQARPITNSAVVRLLTVDANPNARITGLDPLPGKTNYFIGNNPKKWHTNVPSYAKVKYENIYPGIDLVYYGNEGNLEYDFNVAPGADPSRIALSVEGADGVHIDEAGNLVLRTPVGEVSQHAPRIYQQVDGRRQAIAGGYKLLGPAAIENPKSKIQRQLVAFELAGYDASKPLVIDPELVYATYFGGSSETDIKAIAVDAAGSVYVAGDTFAHDFPTKSPLQSTNNHSQSLSAVITKLSPDGQSLVYSTYLGGSDTFALDAAVGIDLDSTGAVYVTGSTGSSDFPTRNAAQPTRAGISTDAFVAKISPDGSSLVYSTYLGGTGFENPRGIILDASNSAYVFGDTQSTDFPTVHPTQATPGGNGHRDGFWAVISADGSQLLFSTYVGGNDDDDVRQLGVFPQSGDVWITGQTQSSDFAGNNAGALVPYQGYYGRSGTASYAVESLAHPSSIIPTPGLTPCSTCGTSGVRCASDQHFGVTGCGEKLPQGFSKSSATASSTDIELFATGFCAIVPPATTCSEKASVITEDARTLTVKSAVNIADNVPPSVSVAVRDSQDAIYVTGVAERTDAFPLVNPIQSVSGGSTDAYVMVFAPSTRQILFSTYLGGSGHDEPNGIVLDPQGNIYIAGQTTSPNFPTRNAFQSTPPAPNGVQQGQGNSFIVKVSAIGPIQTGPDFSLGIDQSTVTGQAGTKARITVNINRTGGFTGNVTVTPATPGGGIRPKPADPITTTDNSVTFKMKIGGGVAPGTYQLTFTGTDASGRTRTATVTLNVQ